MSPYLRKFLRVCEKIQSYLSRIILKNVCVCVLSAKISDDLFLQKIDSLSTHFFLYFGNRKIFAYFSKFPTCFRSISVLFSIIYVTFFSPVLTMMHLCIIQYMNRSTRRAYWKPLPAGSRGRAPLGFWRLRPRKLSDFWNTN